MSKNKPTCKGCEFSSAVIKQSHFKGQIKEKHGTLCCHYSERVHANELFTGTTSPRWCPLKHKEG